MAISIGPATDFGLFTRGSDATYFDASGMLRTAGSNVLRLDHDRATGKALGVRLEGAGTSLSPWSTDFSSTSPSWSSASVFTLVPVASVIDGKQATLHINPGVDSSRGRNLGLPTLALATDYTASFIVENVDATEISWGLYRASPNAWVGLARYSWVTGEITQQQGALVSSKVEDWGTGPNGGPLRRLIATIRSYADEVTSRFYVYPTGVQLNADSCIIHHAQFEQGLFASSPILTTSDPATRPADSLTFARAGTPEGAVVIEARSPLGIGGNQVLWQWDDGTDDNRYRLVRTGDGKLHAVVTVAGVDVVDLDLGPAGNSTNFKVVATWQAGQFAASLNGAAAVVDTAYTGLLPDCSIVRCGAGVASGSEWFGTVARFSLFDRAYSAADLQGMSA